MSVQQGGEPKASTVPTSAANSGDVWMHIMTFVEPADIISLRKTCSTFREVSEHRGIWITAAKRVCADHGLFSGAFPFLTMSRLELEQLALGPTRFASIINEPIKEDLKGRPPARTRTFYPKVQPGGETLHIDSLRLLPGGRYLLTWTRSVGLFIWDLGFNASASLPMLPLARLSSKACFYLDQATPTPDRQGVRVRCIVRYVLSSAGAMEILT
ncbi:hypothetical protein BKA70DRAFT_1088533 [Coprinopsis sp. MPI-PUGE-AT-0042]|nr:hypothetical protein BKA70DRAFT_1088533 [Coprinopsis sp. MPI-PUGE-AT-0042]